MFSKTQCMVTKFSNTLYDEKSDPADVTAQQAGNAATLPTTGSDTTGLGYRNRSDVTSDVEA